MTDITHIHHAISHKNKVAMADSSPSATSIPMAAFEETQISPAENSSSLTARPWIHSDFLPFFMLNKHTHRTQHTSSWSKTKKITQL
jgi:hypothetical protein